ncbi:patatin-like phospholipase family protein [Nafulsella turpanensis]|uniref:patatin-like phospholipase family protein n=1 Tax=Nafulsella turpanensis TaxID=1265690 RepID=UPI00035EEF2B|nr:patatin-like phospholipase family protein [Nafulsella turpanensis]
MSQIKILSIDGGGTRGVIPATILDCVYQDTGKAPKDIFYLMAGTSTGGILCTGYAVGLPTRELRDLYLKKAKNIFYDTGWDDLRDGFGKNTGADYSNVRLKKELKAAFNDKTVFDIYQRNLASDLGRLMVCTFDLNPEVLNPETGEKYPVNFRPKVYHSDFMRDADEKLVDICLKTSAGPTYFPVYKNFVDGGVSLNNPSMAAVAYAINKRADGKGEYRHPDGVTRGLGKNLQDLKVLSLGCGTSNRNYIPEAVIKARDNGDWGNLQWIKYLPDMLTESNMQASSYYVDQLLAPSQYKRIQLFFDRPEAPDILRGESLGPDVKRRDLLEAMVQYAEEVYRRNRSEILSFLDLAPLV